MSSEQNELTADNPETANSRILLWSRRRTMWLVAATGIALPLLWCVWPFLGWPDELIISPETTYLTTPIDRDGYIDYVAYFSSERKQAGAVSLAADPWQQLHQLERSGENLKTDLPVYKSETDAYLASLPTTLGRFELQEARTEFQYETLPRLRTRPWTAKDHPEVAEAVASNAAWFDYVSKTITVVDAIGLPPRSTNPWDEAVANILLPGIQVSLEFSRRFRLRAAFRFGNGETIEAMDDIAVAHQISPGGHRYLVELLIKLTMESEAARTTAFGILSTPSPDRELITRVEALPKGDFQKDLINAFNSERLIHLDEIQKIHQTGRFDACSVVSFQTLSAPEAWLLSRRLYVGIDWNAVLRNENVFVDRIVEQISTGSFPKAYPEIRAISNPDHLRDARQRLASTDLLKIRPNTEDFITALNGGHKFDRTYTAATAVILTRRVVQICLRLACWKNKTGTYPDELGQLKSLDGFQRDWNTITTDPFTERPIQYQRTDDGFELLSPGPDGVTGPGVREHFTDETTGDWNQESGDYLWSWPPSEEDG